MKCSRGANEWELEVYAKGRQVNRWPFSDLVSDVMRLTAKVEPSSFSVLDLGCGTGNNVWFFLDCGFHTCGIDIAPTAIAIAQERIRTLGYEDPDLRVGSIVELPWGDAQFDLVVDRGTLSQLVVSDVRESIHDIKRVLKPGGIFLSYYLFGWNSSGRVYGREFAPHSFRDFTQGRFAKSPMATLFDKQLIGDLWSPLRITELRRHNITFEDTDVVEEHFTVHSVKEVE